MLNEMNKKLVAGLIVALLIIASAVVLINVDNNVIDDDIPQDEDTPPVLGNISSFDEAVNGM